MSSNPSEVPWSMKKVQIPLSKLIQLIGLSTECSLEMYSNSASSQTLVLQMNPPEMGISLSTQCLHVHNFRAEKSSALTEKYALIQM